MIVRAFVGVVLGMALIPFSAGANAAYAQTFGLANYYSSAGKQVYGGSGYSGWGSGYGGSGYSGWGSGYSGWGSGYSGWGSGYNGMSWSWGNGGLSWNGGRVKATWFTPWWLSSGHDSVSGH
jgi:hypothetical protein